MYKDGGLIPRGPSGGNYTYVMTGASSTPFIVSAYMKGIRGFDIDLAYAGLKKNHMPGGIMAKSGYEHNTASGGGLHYYMTYGFVPHPLPTPPRGFHEDGAGQTLEYAYQDWTLSQLAKTLGKDDDHRLFSMRAKNYRMLWNEDHQSMWIRGKDYQWKEPFDALRYGKGWVEGNAAQFSWWVPQDVIGLAKLMGGQEDFIKKLDDAFKKAEKHGFVAAKSHDAGESIENRRVGINYGNQPSMHTAFLFNYAGAPWLSQYWSRRVVEDVYSGVSPQYGYSGDEDQGLMGSLAVLMKIGLFSMRGGTAINPIYELGSPIFDKIEIELDERYYPGESFTIEVEDNSKANPYIQSIEHNNKSLEKIWIYHKDLIKGGVLKLKMGGQPNRNLGSQFAYWPPSMTLVE
jgi:predicted alpha-1,2-mannosidase